MTVVNNYIYDDIIIKYGTEILSSNLLQYDTNYNLTFNKHWYFCKPSTFQDTDTVNIFLADNPNIMFNYKYNLHTNFFEKLTYNIKNICNDIYSEDVDIIFDTNSDIYGFYSKFLLLDNNSKFIKRYASNSLYPLANSIFSNKKYIQLERINDGVYFNILLKDINISRDNYFKLEVITFRGEYIRFFYKDIINKTIYVDISKGVVVLPNFYKIDNYNINLHVAKNIQSVYCDFFRNNKPYLNTLTTDISMTQSTTDYTILSERPPYNENLLNNKYVISKYNIINLPFKTTGKFLSVKYKTIINDDHIINSKLIKIDYEKNQIIIEGTVVGEYNIQLDAYKIDEDTLEHSYNFDVEVYDNKYLNLTHPTTILPVQSYFKRVKNNLLIENSSCVFLVDVDNYKWLELTNNNLLDDLENYNFTSDKPIKLYDDIFNIIIPIKTDSNKISLFNTPVLTYTPQVIHYCCIFTNISKYSVIDDLTHRSINDGSITDFSGVFHTQTDNFDNFFNKRFFAIYNSSNKPHGWLNYVKLVIKSPSNTNVIYNFEGGNDNYRSKKTSPLQMSIYKKYAIKDDENPSNYNFDAESLYEQSSDFKITQRNSPIYKNIEGRYNYETQNGELQYTNIESYNAEDIELTPNVFDQSLEHMTVTEEYFENFIKDNMIYGVYYKNIGNTLFDVGDITQTPISVINIYADRFTYFKNMIIDMPDTYYGITFNEVSSTIMPKNELINELFGLQVNTIVPFVKNLNMSIYYNDPTSVYNTLSNTNKVIKIGPNYTFPVIFNGLKPGDRVGFFCNKPKIIYEYTIGVSGDSINIEPNKIFYTNVQYTLYTDTILDFEPIGTNISITYNNYNGYSTLKISPVGNNNIFTEKLNIKAGDTTRATTVDVVSDEISTTKIKLEIAKNNLESYEESQITFDSIYIDLDTLVKHVSFDLVRQTNILYTYTTEYDTSNTAYLNAVLNYPNMVDGQKNIREINQQKLSTQQTIVNTYNNLISDFTQIITNRDIENLYIHNNDYELVFTKVDEYSNGIATNLWQKIKELITSLSNIMQTSQDALVQEYNILLDNYKTLIDNIPQSGDVFYNSGNISLDSIVSTNELRAYSGPPPSTESNLGIAGIEEINIHGVTYNYTTINVQTSGTTLDPEFISFIQVYKRDNIYLTDHSGYFMQFDKSFYADGTNDIFDTKIYQPGGNNFSGNYIFDQYINALNISNTVFNISLNNLSNRYEIDNIDNTKPLKLYRGLTYTFDSNIDINLTNSYDNIEPNLLDNTLHWEQIGNEYKLNTGVTLYFATNEETKLYLWPGNTLADYYDKIITISLNNIHYANFDVVF